MVYVALVTDRAGSFPLVLDRPCPHLIDGGKVIVSTLATFVDAAEAVAFLEQLQGVEMQERERTPAEHEVLQLHGLVPAADPTRRRQSQTTNYVVVLGFDTAGVRPLILRDDVRIPDADDVRCRFVAQTDDHAEAVRVAELLQRAIEGGELRRGQD